uniref:Uncharacterized protein n=1 Tax=Arundo donax TaxID=35708 RepID=A0A0A9E9J1_ARUDO
MSSTNLTAVRMEVMRRRWTLKESTASAGRRRRNRSR